MPSFVRVKDDSIVYRGIFNPLNEAKEGEIMGYLVSKEVNGYIIWVEKADFNHEGSYREFHQFESDRSTAIETTVLLVDEARQLGW